jgi:hypothetical protein
MKRFLQYASVAAIGLMLIGAPRIASAADVHVSIGIPAPPAVVFHTEPEVTVVPHSRVYYVPSATDYDMYRYGGYWYVNRGGYWYRSTAYDGPFAYVEYNRLPHQIVVVPSHYRHHPVHPPHHHDHHDHHYHH